MKILSGIFAAVGILCLLFAIPLGIGGFSDFQNDQTLERYPAEVVSLRVEDTYVHPVVRYNCKGTDYQMIIRNQDFYQGEQLQVLFRDGTPQSAEVYRDSPFRYGKVLGALVLACAGVVFLAIGFWLLRMDKRMENNPPHGFLSPLFFGIAVAALCALTVVNVVARLPQNLDNEQDYTPVQATVIMAPAGGQSGDTVVQYDYNGKTYKAKAANKEANAQGKEITLYIQYKHPGLAKEQLNNLTPAVIATVVLGIAAAFFLFLGFRTRR